MAVNKVIYDNKTLIDLTEDTVTSDTMIAGTTAHNASGETIVGELIVGELKPATNSTLGGVIVGNGINVDENGKIDVDKNSIGLGSVDNTSDMDKPISTKVQEALTSLSSLIATLENKVNTNEDDIEGKVTTINTTINTIKNDISAINTILTSNDTDLDTLQELVNALKSNVASINDIFTQLGKKVDKTTTVNGYPLSSNVTLGKSDVGLGNVLNVESYSKSESDSKYANKFTVGLNLELDDADDLHVVDEPKFIAVETNTLKVNDEIYFNDEDKTLHYNATTDRLNFKDKNLAYYEDFQDIKTKFTNFGTAKGRAFCPNLITDTNTTLTIPGVIWWRELENNILQVDFYGLITNTAPSTTYGSDYNFTYAFMGDVARNGNVSISDLTGYTLKRKEGALTQTCRVTYYGSDGHLNTGNGYGGNLVKGSYYGGFYFSRIYNEQGDEGWWQQQYFELNEKVIGTVYYRIVR